MVTAAANCTVQIAGLGGAGTSGGATIGVARSVIVRGGGGMERISMGMEWEGLSEVTISGQSWGRQMGVGVGEVVYELTSAC